MNKIHLTKAHQFWPLTDYMSGFGVPVGRYIERFHISKKILDAPELYIDEVRFWRLAGDLAEREGFLDWGFRAAQQLDLSVLGEFGTNLLQQPSLKVALETFVKTACTESLHAHWELMRQGEYFWLILWGYRDAPAGRSVIELYDLELMSTLVRSALGNQWCPPAVHLRCASLPEGLAASEICTGNIRFSSTMTAIAIPEALVAEPMSHYRPFSVAHTGVQQNTQDQTDFATSLRLLLTGYLDEGMTMTDCADLVGMSERTLQRRLAQHETTFSKLLDQTRFDMAKQRLQDGAASLSEIGYDLGYENPANFTRAFRRWAGVSPRQYRLLASQPG
jgi:AraC-like DNA-binding protein